MAIQNAINLTTTGIVTADGSGVFTGSTVTEFGVVIASSSNLVSSIAPSATVGLAVVSAGAAVNPAFGVVSVAGGGTGGASFTAGSVIFSNGTILTEDNSNLFWDDTNNRLSIGANSGLHDTFEVFGNADIHHTAAETDDHALEIECDAAGFGDVKALDIDYITGAITGVQDEECMLINIDETASTGGIVNGYEVLTTAEGSAVINGYTTGINVNPVVHESGTFGNADDILNIAVDVTAALASGGAGGISIFVADNDTFTIGDAATWDEFEIILDTGASGAGVAPLYEFSTGGAGFDPFSPADGTNGFRNSGAILFDSASLSGWATATSGRFEIRITRTRNSLSTTPIIDELQISSTTEFKWDSSGDVNINSLVLVTDLAVAHGGTGLSTITDHGVMVGSGTSAVTPLTVGTNGQLLVGSSSADPVFATITSSDSLLTLTTGAGTLDIVAQNAVSAAAALTDNLVTRGDGGATGVQTSTVSITDAGEMTNASQPAFNALVGSQITNVTGDGTIYTVIFGTERFDQGSDYATATGIFTAPVDGKYQLQVGMRAIYPTGQTNSQCFMTTSNEQYMVWDVDSNACKDSNGNLCLGNSFLADMDATDTARVQFQVQGGALDVDVQPNLTHFTGSLIC